MENGDLDKRLLVVEQNLEQIKTLLEKIGKDIDDFYERMYENGQSAKINALWDWKGKLEKVLLSVLIIVLGALITAYFVKPDIDDRLNRIETKIEALKIHEWQGD